MKTLPYSLRNLLLALALIVSASLVTTRAFGDDIPTFSDPDLNNFVKSYAQFVNDYVEACKAAKSGDTSKVTALQPRAQELQTQAAQVAGKLKPDEAPKFQTFIATYTQKITDALK